MEEERAKNTAWCKAWRSTDHGRQLTNKLNKKSKQIRYAAMIVLHCMEADIKAGRTWEPGEYITEEFILNLMITQQQDCLY